VSRKLRPRLHLFTHYRQPIAHGGRVSGVICAYLHETLFYNLGLSYTGTYPLYLHEVPKQSLRTMSLRTMSRVQLFLGMYTMIAHTVFETQLARIMPPTRHERRVD